MVSKTANLTPVTVFSDFSAQFHKHSSANEHIKNGILSAHMIIRHRDVIIAICTENTYHKLTTIICTEIAMKVI